MVRLGSCAMRFCFASNFICMFGYCLYVFVTILLYLCDLLVSGFVFLVYRFCLCIGMMAVLTSVFRVFVGVCFSFRPKIVFLVNVFLSYLRQQK